MSTFPMPETPMPDTKTMEAQLKQMQDQMAAMMPKEFAGAANLMAHPMAAAAAGSAIGLAMASHAFGLWAGAVAGGVEASQKLLGLDLEEPTEAFRAPRSAAVRAKAAADTIVADMERAAKETAEAAKKVTDAVADDMREAAKAASRPLTITDSIRMARPHLPDDLKAISGVGPKLEKVLNDLGIWTYGQVAAWSDEQIAWLDEHLGFPGRIGRDDWIGQAKKLGGKS